MIFKTPEFGGFKNSHYGEYMGNVYFDCPTLENDLFLLRLATKRDSDGNIVNAGDIGNERNRNTWG